MIKRRLNVDLGILSRIVARTVHDIVNKFIRDGVLEALGFKTDSYCFEAQPGADPFMCVSDDVYDKLYDIVGHWLMHKTFLKSLEKILPNVHFSVERNRYTKQTPYNNLDYDDRRLLEEVVYAAAHNRAKKDFASLIEKIEESINDD